MWKQSETKHNELLDREWGEMFGQKCATLHYARCNRFCVAHLVPQECTMKVQEGKFKLQDLLVVPMQRVLKYHLLLKARACSTHLNPPLYSSVAAGTGRLAHYYCSLSRFFSHSNRGSENEPSKQGKQCTVHTRSFATFASFPVIINALYECNTSGLYW